MYKWDRKNIKDILNYLNKIEANFEEIDIAKESLKNLLNPNKESELYNIKNDKEEFKNLNELINIITSKYYKEDYSKVIEYKNIIATPKDKLLLIQDILNNINPKCYKQLSPIFDNETCIDIKKNNSNYMYFIKYIGKYYISLSINNDISDFTNIIHEFMHVYSTMLNKQSYYRIDNELMSVFGEFVILEEIKERNLFGKEPNKAEKNGLKYILEFIREIIIRKNVLQNNNINYKKYLKKEFNFNKTDIKNLYKNSIDYMSSTLIAFFVAVELIGIYKTDKEKAIYIAENIIKDNSPLQIKLIKNNICPLTNSDEYIKTLKKEYYI